MSQAVFGQVGVCDVNQKDTWAPLSDGTLDYTPADPSDPARVVDDLALILTAGRLSLQTRAVLLETYTYHVAEARVNITDLQACNQER